MDFLKEITTSTATVAQGDYYKDGLLYCGKCHTQKEYILKKPTGDIKVRALCQCETSNRDKKQTDNADALRRERIDKNRYEAFPDQRMRTWTFDNDDRENAKLSDIASKYVENFTAMRKRGMGLLLFGGVGVGKTYASACIANALIDNGYKVMVTNFARLSNTLMGMYEGKQEYIDSLNKCDLLVIDDLAAERDTEYMGEVVQNVIDARYRAELPLIVTTNLTGDELKHPRDIRRERIFSRLFEMCIPYEVKGVDRRKRKARDSNKDLRELLGI